MMQFLIRKGIYKVKIWDHDRHESVSIAREILGMILWETLLAFIFVSVIEVIDNFLLFNISQLHINQSSLVSILSTLAQISGVLLGLYFTTIGLVISTIYARAPDDTRSLLIKEKVGNIYVHIIAFLGVISILLLLCNSLGFSPGILSMFIVALLGVFAIFSFLRLGVRTFRFFNPALLTNYVSHNLLQWVNYATVKGLLWNDSSFQKHYQQEAEKALNSFDKIVHFTIEEKHPSGEVVNKMAFELLAVLQVYLSKKSFIPHKSYWFKQVPYNRNWLTADYEEVKISLSAETFLKSETKADYMWFETKTKEILFYMIEVLIKQKELNALVNLYNRIQVVLESASGKFSVEESLHLFSSLSVLTQKEIAKFEMDALNLITDEQLNLTIGIIDIYAMGLISILLGFSKKLQTITAESFSQTITGIKWDQEKSIYNTGFPHQVAEQLEYIRKGLDFERAVEGREISPDWYRIQLAALSFARFLKSNVNSLVKELNTTFVEDTGDLISQKQYVFATQLILRGLEACNKFAFCIEEIEKCFDRLGILRRVPDIPWPTVDWDKLKRNIKNVHRQLLSKLGQTVFYLDQSLKLKFLPDYFGHIYFILAKESYNAMINGDEDLFQKIFPSFFFSCWEAYKRTNVDLVKQDSTTRALFSEEYIMDLLEFSGYTIIYSELDNKQYWDITKKLWDSYLDKSPNSQNLIKGILSMLDFRSSQFAILPHSIMFIELKQKLEEILSKRNLLQSELLYQGGFYSEKEKLLNKNQHPSAIIRALTSGGILLSRDPRDVFTVIYLMKRPEAKGLKLPRKVQGFASAYEQENKNKEPQ